MENEKENNNRTSHFWGLGKGQSLQSVFSLGLRLRGLPSWDGCEDEVRLYM